jgi:hypothetical protein
MQMLHQISSTNTIELSLSKGAKMKEGKKEKTTEKSGRKKE